MVYVYVKYVSFLSNIFQLLENEIPFEKKHVLITKHVW